MFRLLAAIAAIALSFASAATAQQKVDSSAAEGAAKAMISQAKAEGIFSSGSWDYGPVVRHVRSGMSCRFLLNEPANSITVFDPAPGRGDDVGCNAIVAGVLTSHFASRASLVGSFESFADAAIQAFDERGGASAPYTGEVFELEAATMPPTRVHRRVVEMEGRKFYERIALIDLGEWIVTQRMTAPLEAAPSVDRMATIGLALMAKEMRARAKSDDRG